MSYVVQPVRDQPPKNCRQSARIHAAQELFQRFHCFPAENRFALKTNRTIPPVVVALGQLKGLIYRSDRGQRGKPRTFIHLMESPTWLASDPEGRQLFILGGKYRVTPKGIEG